MFTEKLKNNGIINKVRGTNYLVKELRFSKEKTLKETATAQNKITILPLNKALTTGQELLQTAFFYNNPNVSPVEFANSIKNINWTIRNEKIIAPEGKSQKELDKALLVLGIDNSGELPSLKYKSKNAKEGFLSIGTSEVQKAKYVIKDEAMANASTKAIGKATVPFNDKYQSSSEAYANAIETTAPNALAKAKSTKEQFVPTDKVWVFGSTITERAYLGRTKEEFVAEVEKTFNAYHKPLIDKAIKAGVKTFNVGTALGIDKMASEYLQTKGFVPVVRYSELGTYNEFILAADLAKTTGQNFDPMQQEIKTSTYSVYNELLDSLYENTNRFTPKWFSGLTASDLIGNGKNIVKDRILQTIAAIDNNYRSNNTTSFRIKLANELRLGSGGRLAIGNTLFDSMVEEVLMSFRADIISKRTGGTPVSSVTTIEDPVLNNQRYNEAVADFIAEDNTQPLKVGDEVTVYFKSSDNDQEMEISSVQKISNNLFRIKLDAGNGKEYTYTVDNNGNGEKIDIYTWLTTESTSAITTSKRTSSIFEKIPGALEMKKAKADLYSLKTEAVSQGQLSTPTLSPVAETITINRQEVDENNQLIVVPVKVKAYKITYAEHPNAKFYLISDKQGFNTYALNANTYVDTTSLSPQNAFYLFATKMSQFQNVSLNNDQVVDIISRAGMDIELLTAPEGVLAKYTYLTLPFTKAQKETILVNFANKYIKSKSTREAQQYIEEALAKRDEPGQKEIIELLKECYK